MAMSEMLLQYPSVLKMLVAALAVAVERTLDPVLYESPMRAEFLIA